MSGISPLMWGLFVWAAVTAVFVVLMIYRSLITMREDDQLFLDPAQTVMENEQKAIQTMPDDDFHLLRALDRVKK